MLWDNYLHSEISMEPNREGKSQLAAPIHLRGKCLGALYIESNRLDAFASDDLNAMESVVSLIASKLHSLQVFKNSQRSGEYLQAILESADDWAIFSTDIHGYVLTCSVGAQRLFHLSQQEILGNDVLTLFADPRIRRELIALINSGATASCLERFHVPQANGELTAYLDVNFQRVYHLEEHHIGFVGVVRDVTEKVLLERRLKKLSVTDDVSGLYNQRGFFRVLKAEMRRSKKFRRNFSLCFLDLDGLKQFNDTYGHLCGSQVLRETAGLLRELLRSGVDTCCRYGGDEFAIILPQTNKIKAQVPIERIRAKLSEHFQQRITASFGIADFSDNSIGVTELLARADRAMYRAKAQGKNCIVLSDC
jgi:diguanylate cyclase (GGDEF)-like protein/PAS domain S-box-containing protein